MEFISSCMKIHDSMLVMQLFFFGSLLVLFVLYFDCNRYAFAILYNDAVMQNYYYTTPSTRTTDTTGTTHATGTTPTTDTTDTTPTTETTATTGTTSTTDTTGTTGTTPTK